MRVEGKQNSLFPDGLVIKCFAKFLEAFIQILLFAEVSQRSHALSVALLLDLEC